MNNKKKLFPFIKEWIAFLICNNVVIISMISIILKVNSKGIYTICFVIGIYNLIITAFFRIGNIGFKALIDMLFKKHNKNEFEFLKMQRYKASYFTQKNGHSHYKKTGVKPRTYASVYYLIYVKKDDDIYTFISPFYIDLIKGNKYSFTTSHFSRVVLETNTID